jgi:hypothetical protein
MSSLDPLRPHLWPGYTAHWTETQWLILEALSDRRNPGGQVERAVTKMLCAVDGPLGRTLARIFTGLRGLPVNENAEMIDPNHYADPPGNHAPDMAVRDAAWDRLLLVVEGKKGAKINFAEKSCPRGIEACNQVICYPSNCWTSPATLTGTRFLWLHPQDTNPWASGWHEGHLGNRRHEESVGGPEQLRRLVDNQRVAIDLWDTATWEDLVKRVQALHDPAAGVIATIISTWIERPVSP